MVKSLLSILGINSDSVVAAINTLKHSTNANALVAALESVRGSSDPRLIEPLLSIAGRTSLDSEPRAMAMVPAFMRVNDLEISHSGESN